MRARSLTLSASVSSRGAYWELTARGYHLYAMIQVGRVFRDQFNERLKAPVRDLRTLAKKSGFQLTIEVTGRFTIMQRPDEIGPRGQMGAWSATRQHVDLWVGTSFRIEHAVSLDIRYSTNRVY